MSPGPADLGAAAPPARRSPRAWAWWPVGAVFVVGSGTFVASLPPAWDELRQTCPAPPCEPTALGPDSVASLRAVGLTPDLYAWYLVVVAGAFAATSLAVAWALWRRRAEEPVAVAAALALGLFGLLFPQTVEVLADEPVLGPVVDLLTTVGVTAFVWFLLVFPDGRFRPRWAGPVGGGLVAYGAVTGLLGGWPLHLAVPETLRLVETLAVVVVVVTAQAQRYRRSSATEREQTRWVVAALVVALVALVGAMVIEGLGVADPGTPLDLGKQLVLPVAFAAIPVAVWLTLARHRLWGVEVVVNRALAATVLLVVVGALYVGVVVVVGGLAGARQGNLAVSLVATIAVAAAFQPVRHRSERAVRRLLFGVSDDPQQALALLGHRLGVALDPQAVLPTVVETVASALRLPFVAVHLDGDDDGPRRSTTHGEAPPSAEVVTVALRYGGEPVGTLHASARWPGERLGRRDREALETIGRQVAGVVHAARLWDDLERSRRLVIVSREDERRRLRRDLHDGLGPTLASIIVLADVAKNTMGPSPVEAEVLLDEVKHRGHEAVAEVRRVINGLRPPVLDALGLAGAIADLGQPAPAGADGLRVEVDADDADLADLPAAVELAAYRIASEAYANALRHASASSCRVRLRVDDRLCMEIVDDGVGIDVAGAPGTGLGLRSIVERAREIGGSATVDRGPGGGTVVTVHLPVDLSPAEGP